MSKNTFIYFVMFACFLGGMIGGIIGTRVYFENKTTMIYADGFISNFDDRPNNEIREID